MRRILSMIGAMGLPLLLTLTHASSTPLSRLQNVAGGGPEKRSTQASSSSNSAYFATVTNLIKLVEEGQHAQIAADLIKNKDLDTLFSQPDVVNTLLQEMPILKVFNGVKEYYDRGAALNAADGLKVLNELRAVATEGLKASAKLSGEGASGDIVEDLRKYAESPDPVIRELVRQVGLGNDTANLELQQRIADDSLGGLVDLGAMGLNGEEPEAFKSLRDRFLSEPLFASFLDDLPAGKDSVLEPFNVAKKALAAVEGTAAS